MGIVDMLFYGADNGSNLQSESDVDTAWFDDISGFYDNRWVVTLFQRIGDRMVSMMPHLMLPSQGTSLSEYLGNRSFRWVEGDHNGAFGETTQIERADGHWRLKQGESISEPFDFDYPGRPG